jgi:AraC-like DNA-binding protein
MLLASPGSIPALPEVASRLHLSPRTLRRKLEATGNSYNQILEDVRKKLAIRYLLDTPLTTEAISEKLSYSDAANFRHAFKRWTGTAPRAFRSQNRDADWSMSPAFTLPAHASAAQAAHA